MSDGEGIKPEIESAFQEDSVSKSYVQVCSYDLKFHRLRLVRTRKLRRDRATLSLSPGFTSPQNNMACISLVIIARSVNFMPAA